MADKYKFDLNSVEGKNYTLFYYFGSWKPDDDYKYKCLYNFYTYFCFFVSVLFLLPQFVYMVVNGNDIMEVTATLYVFCTFFITFFKMFGLYVNMGDVKAIIKIYKDNSLLQVKSDWHFKEAKLVKKIADILFWYSIFLGSTTQVFWTFTTFFSSERVLPTNTWYPFDAMSSPAYEIISIFQNIVSALSIYYTLNIDLYIIDSVMEVGMECDFLQYTLVHLTHFDVTDGVLHYREDELRPDQSFFNEKMKNNLKLCIQHHTAIKRIADYLENICGGGLMMLFIGGAFTICSIFYQIMHMERDLTSIAYLAFYVTSMLSEQFFLCRFGTQMTYKSERLHHAVFCIPSWPDCDEEFRKIMLNFMTSLNKPLVTIAGSIIPLSLTTFVSVIRSSYSYLALLNSL